MTISAPPYAPSLRLPLDGTCFLSSDPVVFTWSHYAPGHPFGQTAADLRYKVYGAGAWTTITTAATTAETYTMAGGTWPPGDPSTSASQYEWQVRTYRAGSTAGPWSNSFYLTSIDQWAAATITAPADASAQTVTPVLVTWTLPVAVDWLDAYRVRRANTAAGTGTVYYDSGIVDMTGKPEARVPLDVCTARTDYLLLTYRFLGVWSVAAVASIVVTILAPKVPLFTAIQVPGRPEVVISIARTDGFIGWEATAFNDIYRGSVRIATNVIDGGSFTDLLPGAEPNTYTVHGITAGGARTISY